MWQGYTKNKKEFHTLTQINYSKDTQEALEFAKLRIEHNDPVFIKTGFGGRIIFESMWTRKGVKND
jgi:thiamine pyrophosphokinase